MQPRIGLSGLGNKKGERCPSTAIYVFTFQRDRPRKARIPARLHIGSPSGRQPNSEKQVNERFYEKVVKVKADVAALHCFISVFVAFGTSVPPCLRLLVSYLSCSLWFSPH